MRTLHVHSVPEELYNRLRTLAQVKHRSLGTQGILLLDKALEAEVQHEEQAQILADIQRRRFTPPSTASDSVEMRREDRNR